jgi:hypothetical protein
VSNISSGLAARSSPDRRPATASAKACGSAVGCIGRPAGISVLAHGTSAEPSCHAVEFDGWPGYRTAQQHHAAQADDQDGATGYACPFWALPVRRIGTMTGQSVQLLELAVEAAVLAMTQGLGHLHSLRW